MNFQKLIFSGLVFLSGGISASPFTQCPAEAFLVQNKLADLYSLQLATGYYQELSADDWNQNKMNALAFNTHDNYLYAYNYYYGTIVRLDKDLNLTPLFLTNLPNIGFYVGDIAIDANHYYLYRPGSNYGLYRISLNETDDDYLVATRVVKGDDLNLAIFDLAFHPSNSFAYSVDRWGNLWRIDVLAGEAEKISNVGVSGIFGAVYFDVDGRLYVSRNSDGYIFRIETASEYPTAEFFAYGPSSSNNDGARCALAPIVSMQAPTTDFGDAPDSYGTSINNNGARHDIGDGSLYLGTLVNQEPNAYAQSAELANDNDGVEFVTGFEVSQPSVLEVSASKAGVLNAWVDWDGSGHFDTDEQIASDLNLQEGLNPLVVDVPAWATAERTWARFRLSSQAGLAPTGGVADGEVEDYPVEINAENVQIFHYPSENGLATLAFEDNWPLKGDYDMNDVVIQYRLSRYEINGSLSKIRIQGALTAMGAAYHSGFAFRIGGLAREDVDEARIQYRINNHQQDYSPLEDNRDEAILIVAENLWNYVTPGENCEHYRTKPGCGSDVQFYFEMDVPVKNSVDANAVQAFPFDPFIFASKDTERGYLFGEAPGRRYEIHLQNQAPTEAFQEDFFGRGDDDSDISLGRYFVSSNGMPWALNIPYEWRHPLEYMDIQYAYPYFHEYVLSSGQEQSDWFAVERSNSNNLFAQ